MDVTVILEKPKLRDYVDAMRARWPPALGIDAARVSVKGKTNEGVDAIGRGEASPRTRSRCCEFERCQRSIHDASPLRPEPDRPLHVGNARTALFNWLLARGQGGTFILRIEDTDAERSTRESEAAILDDLRWLGLDWDEGPDVGGAARPVPAVRAAALYQSYAQELLDAGARVLLLLLDGAARGRAPGSARGRTAGRATPAPAAGCRATGARRGSRRRAAGDPLPRAGRARRRLHGRGARRRPVPAPTSSAIR